MKKLLMISATAFLLSASCTETKKSTQEPSPFIEIGPLLRYEDKEYRVVCYRWLVSAQGPAISCVKV